MGDITFKLRRGTKAAIDALAGSNGLTQWEPFFLTDEQRFGLCTSVNTYVLAAKKTEIGGGGGSTFVKGTVILDFTSSGSDQATVTIPFPTTDVNTQVYCDLSPIGTVDNDSDEHMVEPSRPRACNIVPGVSFDITMVSVDGFNLFGTYLVNYTVF